MRMRMRPVPLLRNAQVLTHRVLDFLFLPIALAPFLSDDAGLLEMLKKNIDYFKSKPVNIRKITILLDNGYHPDKQSATMRENLSSNNEKN